MSDETIQEVSYVNIDELVYKAKMFKAGNIALSHHVYEWEKLTKDEEILQIVRGDIIEFINNEQPVRHSSRKCNFAHEDHVLVREELADLLGKNIISQTRWEEIEYLSPIFPVHKPDDSGLRIILNLKDLNRDVVYHHFKMDTIKTVLLNITPGCYMASIDLKHAYHAIKIHEDYQRFLKFKYEDVLFQYTCYPNGLGPCPRKFTKLMKVPLSHLREKRCCITGYIDDFFLMGLTYLMCEGNMEKAIKLFQKLGFTIHPTKSSFIPSTLIVFLGFLINSVTMTITLTDKKKKDLNDLISTMLTENQIVIRTVSKVIGKIVASLPASLLGPLFYRNLERDKNKALVKNRGNYEAKMCLSDNAKQDLRWWKQNIWDVYAPIQWPPITKEIATDASSLYAWGASYETQTTGGAWLESESNIHINVKEMLAIYYAVRSYRDQLQGNHVRVLCDNTTSVSVINKMGSTKSPECNEVAQKIWIFCQKYGIFLTCTHIPGKDNVIADFESRKTYRDAEWMLNKDIYQKSVRKLDFQTTIDCFASRINTQHEKYASFKPDPYATYIDAFSFNWQHHNCYIFPPFSLVAKVLQKIRNDKATALVVLPKWPTQAWWPLMEMMQIGYPITIKPSANNLVLPNRTKEIHPLHKKLNLVICLLSGKTMNLRV